MKADQIQYERCLKLWRCALLAIITDAFRPAPKGARIKLDTWQARRALRFGNSRMKEICDWLDIDAGRLQTWAQEMEQRGWPPSERKVWRKRVEEAQAEDYRRWQEHESITWWGRKL